ncbi:MAG: aminoacyl-histidine dipeptidase [Ruminococcaceae bacterium]|nr:aminoacyl-histidine dipeptidase [Oscillospiraceae bacterium]
MLSNNFAYVGLMKYFEELSAIPRASYKEEKIADYLCEFAKKHGYEYYRDSTNNVLINAPATKGYEEAPALLLQGHTDMVCEKNEGVEHDFDNDGLELYEEDGWIRARGTTLGADNGIAVAIMLYVLDGGVEGHGPLQCLFTASEEVGLDGAKSFDYSRIYARRMLNMDSADEELIIAGCAGGQRSSLTFESKTKLINTKCVARVCVKGLMGGHSGEDIDKGRANANKLMGRVLSSLMADKALGVKVVSIYGGTKDNAIPRECEATLCVSDFAVLENKCKDIESVLRDGLSVSDKALRLEVEQLVDKKSFMTVIDDSTARKLVFLMRTVPNGVFEMNYDVEGIVEWSRNLGIVSCDAEAVEAVFSSRSSFETRIDASAEELDAYAEMLGAKSKHYNRYPGWNFAPTSALRDAYLDAAEAVCGKRPEITTIHAGLECGFISQAVPDMDIISCGPVILDLHSPDERLDKKSFERFYSIIKRVIEG